MLKMQQSWQPTLTEIPYQSGFEGYFSTESRAGALPADQNSPQKCPFGLYAEQLSGTAFTRTRRENFRTWFYRSQPSVCCGAPRLYAHPKISRSQGAKSPVSPEQYRWLPMNFSNTNCDTPGGESETGRTKKKQETTPSVDFLDSLFPMVSNGISGIHGCSIYHYDFNSDMGHRYFSSSDGEILIIPVLGELRVVTECGLLTVAQGHIAVVPRGMKFKIDRQAVVETNSNAGAEQRTTADENAASNSRWTGYVCENYGAAFQLPDLGPIGANGLANPRHFQYPVAAVDPSEGSSRSGAPYHLVVNFEGAMWQYDMDHSPCNVVAWHGNLAPYRYDLSLFNTINTVSFDHPDPSIFTVLSSPSGLLGEANLDFVIFPPRWMVAQGTFRPPYYHRNFMSEYMGLIHGVYDAKDTGFLPGGASLHNRMAPHGPDKHIFEQASKGQSEAVYQGETLAFMLESNLVFEPSQLALEAKFRDQDYINCWQGIPISNL